MNNDTAVGRWLHINVYDKNSNFSRWIDMGGLSSLERLNKRFGLCIDYYLGCEELVDILSNNYEELLRHRNWLRLGIYIGEDGKISDDFCLNCRCGLDNGLESMLSRSVLAERICRDNYRMLSGVGVDRFLIKDSKALNEEDGKKLQTSGYVKAYGFLIQKAYEFAVDNSDFIEELEQGINLFPIMWRLELLCDMSIIMNNTSRLIQLFYEIIGIKKTLYSDACCTVGNKLYMAIGNSGHIISIDTQHARIRVEAEIKCISNIVRKYSNAYFYEGKIFFLPYSEKEIIVLDIRSKRCECISLPDGDKKECAGIYLSVQIEKYVWMCSLGIHGILKFDLVSGEVTLINAFPEGVCFCESINQDFRDATLSKDRIIFFKEGCNKNISVSVEDDRISIWDDADCSEKDAGIVLEDDTIIWLPDRNEGFCIEEKGKETIKKQLPEYIWNGEAGKYKKIRKAGGVLFALPWCTNCIIGYSIKNNEIFIINWPEDKKYVTSLPDNRVRVDGVHEVGDEIWVVFYRGGNILRLDSVGNYLGCIEIRLSLEQIHVPSTAMLCCVENQSNDLCGWIHELRAL